MTPNLNYKEKLIILKLIINRVLLRVSFETHINWDKSIIKILNSLFCVLKSISFIFRLKDLNEFVNILLSCINFNLFWKYST